MDVLETEFKPLVHTKFGRIELCGVHFSLVLTDGKIAFNVQGSVNQSFYKEKVPGFIFKMAVVGAKGGKLYQPTLRFAYMRSGNLSTDGFYGGNGEDGKSWLMYSDYLKGGEAPMELGYRIFKRPVMGFNLDYGGSDYSFEVPEPSTKKDLLKSYLQCMEQGLEQFKAESQK